MVGFGSGSVWQWLGLAIVGFGNGWGLTMVGFGGSWICRWLGLAIVGFGGGWVWWRLGLAMIWFGNGWVWQWLGLAVVGCGHRHSEKIYTRATGTLRKYIPQKDHRHS